MSFGPFGRNMCAMLLQCLVELPIETRLAHDITIASQKGKARTALQCHGNTAVTQQEQISHSRCLIQTLKKTWIELWSVRKKHVCNVASVFGGAAD